jgi:hypothetical protein
LKKPTGSVRFWFFKPGTGKTEPKKKLEKTEPNRAKPKKPSQTEKTEPNRVKPKKPSQTGLNRFFL